MSRCPLCARTPQYAIRIPFGDQAGCTALPSIPRGRLCPDLRFTIVSPRTDEKRPVGDRNPSGETTISVPSGDQLGEKPPSVRRLTDSPDEVIRKIPPPSRPD